MITKSFRRVPEVVLVMADPVNARSWFSPASVDVATVTDADDVNHQTSVDDFVEDPVVTDPHSIHRVLTSQFGAAWRPRFACQEVDRGTDQLLFGAWESCDRFHRPSGYLDGVATHSSPSIAFTSSHGT
jgi:hypothetical protein